MAFIPFSWTIPTWSLTSVVCSETLDWWHGVSFGSYCRFTSWLGHQIYFYAIITQEQGFISSSGITLLQKLWQVKVKLKLGEKLPAGINGLDCSVNLLKRNGLFTLYGNFHFTKEVSLSLVIKVKFYWSNHVQAIFF